jgi:hypothetical protein
MANATADLIAEPAPLRVDLWRLAWDALASDTLLVLALLALALLMALAAWLPQAPDSATAPIAFSRWLAETQAHFGNPFAFMRQMGLFDLERGSVVHVLLALMVLCLMIRLLESILSVRPTRRSQSLLSSGPSEIISGSSLDEIAAVLRRKRFRVVREGDLLRADRFPLADAGRIAVYLGALVIVTGLTISNVAGWRVDNLTLGVGQTIPIGHGTPYNIRLDALDPTPTGRVALLREADLVGEGNLAIERSMRSAGLALFISGIGPAIRASATFTNGQPVHLQASAASTPMTELLLLLTRDEPDRFFAAPDAGLVVRLSRSAGNSQSVHAQVYRSRTGEVVFDGDIPFGSQVSVENVVFALRTETYAVLDIVRDPGIGVTLAGVVMLTLGLATTSVWPVKRLGAIVDPNGVQLIGDVNQIQPLIRGTIPITERRRWLELFMSAGWQFGLAVLSALVGIVITRSLLRAGMLWPTPSIAPAFLAAWIIGCATAVLPNRAFKWTTLVLAILALAAALIWPGRMLLQGL